MNVRIDRQRLDKWPSHTKRRNKLAPVATLPGAQLQKASFCFSSIMNSLPVITVPCPNTIFIITPSTSNGCLVSNLMVFSHKVSSIEIPENTFDITGCMFISPFVPVHAVRAAPFRARKLVVSVAIFL